MFKPAIGHGTVAADNKDVTEALCRRRRLGPRAG